MTRRTAEPTGWSLLADELARLRREAATAVGLIRSCVAHAPVPAPADRTIAKQRMTPSIAQLGQSLTDLERYARTMHARVTRDRR